MTANPRVKHLLLRVFPISLWIVLIFVFRHAGAVETDAQTQYDLYLQARSPRPFKEVVVVRIDQAAYTDPKLFEGKSPLKPNVVADLLNAIGQGNPAVIGIDLTTDSPEYADMVTPSHQTRYVWAVFGSAQNPPRVDSILHLPATFNLGVSGNSFGIALLPQNSGIVRDTIPVWETPLLKSQPSFSEAILRAYRERTAATGQIAAKDGERIPIMYSKDPVLTYAAAYVLGVKNPSILFRDRIVLVGGTFDDARELRETPIGPMSGVDVWAQAVEAVLAKDLSHSLSPKLILWLELLALAILVAFQRRVRHLRWSALILAAAVIAMGAILSLIAFRNIWTALSFLPMLSGVIVDALWDQSIEHWGRQKQGMKPAN